MFRRHYFSPSKTFYMENVIVRDCPEKTEVQQLLLFLGKSRAWAFLLHRQRNFPTTMLMENSVLQDIFPTCLIIIWHQQLTLFRAHHLFFYRFKIPLKLLNFRPQDLWIPSQAASQCSVNPSDTVFEQEQGDGSLKSLRWGKKKEKRIQYHQCHQRPWVISKASCLGKFLCILRKSPLFHNLSG